MFVSKFIFLFLFLIDGISKYLADRKSFEFNFLNIIVYRAVENPGLSFGLFSEYKYIVVILQLLLSLVILVFILREKYKSLGFKLILCGSFSNIIYRLLPDANGNVIDFININNYFICNFADIYITFGVIIFIFDSLKRKSPERGSF
jgi:lipoprotein signal peptidase